ncbi:MAG: esterase [Burkholderiales bacterium]|nr:esterase [Burkholderiales bacterium]
MGAASWVWLAGATASGADFSFPPYAGDAQGRTEQVTVDIAAPDAILRRYTLRSSQAQRDDAPQVRSVDEHADAPRLRSANPLFDALFALAVDDARLDSVDAISDGAYDDGRPIAARVFQTGEKWTYVWTRDLAYAAHLGLAWFDPARTVASLRFKTSAFRAGFDAPATLPQGSLQIVQDTGSGGSWPVSTDRVAWAWGAEAALAALAPAERADFAALALAALRGTIAADREAAYDPGSGLYGGEQSFLDWRTQTYAPWIVDDLTLLAGSRALSTNVDQYQALRLAARLAAEAGQADESARYTQWAAQLKDAINAAFWIDELHRYASVTSADARPIAIAQFDLLGTALAVIAGVADGERGRDALAHYPWAPFGPPVIAPQQPGVAVYHNRAIWPFVTAYAVRAAALAGNPVLVDRGIDSLLRGAALNLSNMENLEWLTSLPRYDDGPVINSRRQLWSVGGYLGSVAGTLFGMQPGAQGLRIDPYLTPHLRHLLGPGASAELSGLRYQGREFAIRLRLPRQRLAQGRYRIAEVRLNGRRVAGTIAAADLRAEGNRIEVRFGALQPGDERAATVPTVDPKSRDDARVYAPAAPRVELEAGGDGAVTLRIDDASHADVPRSFRVYRDGSLLAQGLRERTWVDRAPPGVRHCYVVQSQFEPAGHRSQTSAPRCVDAGAVQRFALGAEVRIDRAGPYAVEIEYDNHHHEIQTGVTNAVKRLRLLDAGGHEVATGIVQMPQIEPVDGRHPLRWSTPLRVRLAAGTYRIELSDYFNMSALASNAHYGGPGGRGGIVNDARIASLRIVALP